MTRAALLLVVAVLASACGATESPPLVSPTATSTPSPVATFAPLPSPTPPPIPTATPTPVAVPVRAWDVPPRTGVAHLDAIVAAMVTGNAAALEPYLEAGLKTAPCTTVVDQYALVCPPGASTGAQVRYLQSGGGCEGADIRIDPPGSPVAPGGTTIARLAQMVAGQPRFLWMATKSTKTRELYTLYFFNTRGGGVTTLEQGWLFGVSESGIPYFRGVAGLCQVNQSELPASLRQQSDVTFLVAPPP